jgi:mevalonate kinase
MLTHYLHNAIKDIENLIEQTQKDIAAIKVANHSEVFERAKIKNDLIQSFETKKSLLDNELMKMLKESGKTSLEELLNIEQKELLAQMKLKLSELKVCNKQYAKYVVTISQFYNVLLDSIFPRDMEGYKISDHQPASLLKVRA